LRRALTGRCPTGPPRPPGPDPPCDSRGELDPRAGVLSCSDGLGSCGHAGCPSNQRLGDKWRTSATPRGRSTARNPPGRSDSLRGAPPARPPTGTCDRNPRRLPRPRRIPRRALDGFPEPHGPLAGSETRRQCRHRRVGLSVWGAPSGRGPARRAMGARPSTGIDAGHRRARWMFVRTHCCCSRSAAARRGRSVFTCPLSRGVCSITCRPFASHRRT